MNYKAPHKVRILLFWDTKNAIKKKISGQFYSTNFWNYFSSYIAI